MHPLDEFKRDAGDHLPGLIALYDIADAKRRNFHLGHQVVDREIEDLDRQIRSSAALARRVAGDECLAVYTTQSIEPLAAILRAFYKEQEAGWKATGEKDDVTKVRPRRVGCWAANPAAAMTKGNWDCVTSYPPASPFCPFCQGRDFDWQDGGMGVYDATGICRACKASVDITGIEKF